MIGAEELRHLISACDPNRPLSPGDPLYVPFDEGTPVRGTAGRSCIDVLQRLILLQDETCQLFTGFPGTGKTTELGRLRQRLEASRDLPTYCVYVDFEQWLDRYTPVSITDVLRVVAHVLDREATTAEGKDPDEESGYVRRLWDFIAHTDLELQKIGFNAYGASLMLELKNNPTFHQKAEDALRVRFQQFASEARTAMQQAILRLRQAPTTQAQRIVVLADGLEKFTPIREEDRGVMEASVEGVFVQHSRRLHLPCHAVYTFPLWLRFRVAELGGLYDGSPAVLPMVKISSRTACYPVGSRSCSTSCIGGCGISRASSATISSHVPAHPARLGRLSARPLAHGEAALHRRAPFPVGPPTRSGSSTSCRSSMLRRARDNLALLEQIATTHALPQDDAEQIAAFGRLLERWLVLAYRNGDEWYDLHPLVRRAPDRSGAPRGVSVSADLPDSSACSRSPTASSYPCRVRARRRARLAGLRDGAGGHRAGGRRGVDELVAKLVDAARRRAGRMVVGPARAAPGRRGAASGQQRRDAIVRALGRPLLWCGPPEFLKLRGSGPRTSGLSAR